MPSAPPTQMPAAYTSSTSLRSASKAAWTESSQSRQPVRKSARASAQ